MRGMYNSVYIYTYTRMYATFGGELLLRYSGGIELPLLLDRTKRYLENYYFHPLRPFS